MKRCNRYRRVTGANCAPWSDTLCASLARVAEWQTRRTQNPLSERACGFESHLGHERGGQLGPTVDTAGSEQVPTRKEPPEMSTDSVLDFLDDRTLSGRRESTVNRYREVLDRVAADLDKDPLKATPNELRRYGVSWQN